MNREELMDLVHYKTSIVMPFQKNKKKKASIVAEDRISNLPDEVIHCILSFLDMKDAIQTSKLSRKWKNIWTSMPHLNLDCYKFHTLPKFAKFVKQVLSRRNNRTEVSSLKLTFRGAATQFAVKSSLDYAYSHNVQQLMIDCVTAELRELPQRFFSSHTLKHLTLVSGYDEYFPGCYIPNSALDFPVLETLNMRNFRIDNNEKSLNIFSKCVNLKELTVHQWWCHVYLETFIVCAPQLSSLTITGRNLFAKVFNVVAPQLENLTLAVNSVSSFNFSEPSPKGSNCIEKVHLFLPMGRYSDDPACFPVLLDLFQKLCSAKFFTLDVRIIKILSSCPDQISREPCPFNDLRCLKINTGCLTQKDGITIPTELRNYFLGNSPSATFISDIPQVPQKRSRDQVRNDAVANKVARLEAKIKIQGEIIAEQKTKLQMQDKFIAKHKSNIQRLEAAKLQHENFLSHIFKCKMAELKIQIENGNADFDVICSICSGIRSLMDLIPENLRVNELAQFPSQYEGFKRCFITHVDASQWVKIGTELGIIRDSEISCSSNVNIQRLKDTVAMLQENGNSLQQELKAQRVSAEQKVKALQEQVAALTRMMDKQSQPSDPPSS